METRHHLSRVLREVAAGHEVQITRRKQVVARILPPVEPAAIEFPDFAARARDVWGGETPGSSSTELLDESRGER